MSLRNVTSSESPCAAEIAAKQNERSSILLALTRADGVDARDEPGEVRFVRLEDTQPILPVS